MGLLASEARCGVLQERLKGGIDLGIRDFA